MKKTITYKSLLIEIEETETNGFEWEVKRSDGKSTVAICDCGEDTEAEAIEMAREAVDDFYTA